MRIYIIIFFCHIVSIFCYSQSNLFVVEKDGKQGVLDMNTKKLITPIIYDDIHPSDSYYMSISFTAKQGEYITLLDSLGQPILPLSYEYVQPFSSKYLLVSKNKKMGFFDYSGQQVIPFIYTQISTPDVPDNQGLYTLDTDTSCVIVDEDLKTISRNCRDFIQKRRDKFSKIYTLKKLENGDTQYLWGIKNLQTGNTIIKPQYRQIDERGDYFVVRKDTVLDNPYYTYLIGVLNDKGEEVFPFAFNDSKFFKHKIALHSHTNKNWILFNTSTGKQTVMNNYTDMSETDVLIRVGKYGKDGYRNGLYNMTEEKEILPCEYLFAKYEYTASYYVIKKNKRQGAAGPKGIILPCEYDSVNLDNRLFKYSLNGKWGAVNLDGKEVLKPIYEKIQSDYGYDSIVYATKDGITKIIDTNTSKVLPSITYNGQVYLAKNGPVIVSDSIGYLRGLIDGKTAKMIVPTIYDEIYLDDDFAQVYHKDTVGIIDIKKTMKSILPFKTKRIEFVAPKTVSFEKDGKYGLYNIAKKREVTPPIYDQIYPFEGDTIMYKKDDKVAIFDLKTQTYILPFEYSSITNYWEFFPE